VHLVGYLLDLGHPAAVAATITGHHHRPRSPSPEPPHRSLSPR